MAYFIALAFLLPLMGLLESWRQAKRERRRGFRHNL